MLDPVAIDLEPWRREAARRRVPLLDSLILSVAVALLMIGDGSNQEFLMLAPAGALMTFVVCVTFLGPIPRLVIAPLRNLVWPPPSTHGEIDPRCCQVGHPILFFNATVADIRQRLHQSQAARAGVVDRALARRRALRAAGILLVIAALVLAWRLVQGSPLLLEGALAACAAAVGAVLVAAGVALGAPASHAQLAQQLRRSAVRWSALGLLLFPVFPMAVLILIGVIGRQIGPQSKELTDAVVTLYVAAFLGGFIAALKCLRRVLDLLRTAKQAVLPEIADIVAQDRRPPLLLLRSFSDDRVEVDRDRRELWGPSESQRFEELIKEHLTPYGPLIAVGKPGSMPEFGATRAYLAEGAWQTQIIEWMDQALMIIVILGRTPWLRWEIEQIISRGHVHKAIFLLPSGASRPDRWDVLVECFAATPWSAALRAGASQPVRAAYAAAGGRAVLLTSANAQEVDYALALHFATYGVLLHEPASAPTRRQDAPA